MNNSNSQRSKQTIESYIQSFPAHLARRSKQKIAIASLLLLFGSLAFGQTNTLSLSSGSAAQGGSVSLNLSLNASSAPSGLQWTLSYPQTNITSVTISAGAALTAAGKSLLCSSGAGSVTCLGSGMNANAVSNGVVAVVTATLASVVGSPTLTLGVGSASAVTSSGSTLAVSGSGGVITVQGSSPPSPPTAPSNLTGAAADGSHISLAWAASSDPSNLSITYHIERCQGASCTTFAEIATASATAWADSGLTPGTTYCYRVRAADSSNQYSSYSNTAAAATKSQGSAPSYIQGNYATPQSTLTSVPVTFTGAQTAGDLNVVIVGWAGTNAQITSVTDTKGNTYQLAVGPTLLSGVAAQSIYYAKNIAAAAAGSNIVTANFSAAAAYADIRILEYSGVDPNNPLDVTATASGNSAATDSGAVTTKNANDLLVGANYVQTSTSGPGTGFTSRFITSPDGDIAEDQVVTAAGSYHATAPLTSSGGWVMQMAAFRAAGGSDAQPPTAPTNVTAAPSGSSQINLSWTASTDNVGVTGYLIERCQSAGCSNFAQIATSSTAAYSNTGLTAATSYSYRVRATDAAGNLSSYSNTATAATSSGSDTQPPTVPTNLTAAGAGSTQINLSWTASTDNVGVTGYLIERCQGAGCSNFAQIATSTTTSYSNTGLTAGTSYSYRARATDAAGNLSSYSNTATASPAAVSHLTTAYSLGEGSGSTVYDSSGNGLNGTTHNTSWTTPGVSGGSLTFNGTTSYVDLGNPAQLQNTGSMSWSAWVYISGNPSDDAQIVASSNANTGWQLKTSPDTGSRTFAVAVTPPGFSHTQRYSKTVPSLKTWYFVAGVYNASAQTLDIYVNGALDDGVLSGTVPSSQALSNLNTTIGMRSGGYYFNGVMNNLRIYNTALTQAQIQSDMNTPVAPTHTQVSQSRNSESLSNAAAAGSSSETHANVTANSPALSCRPNTVTAGHSATCQISVPASATAQQLHLASSSPHLQLPATVTTRAHQSSVSFEAFIDPAASQQSASVRATLGAGTSESSLQILASPTPLLTVPAKQLVQFGSSLGFQVSAVDPAGLPFTLSAASLPSGASFDPSTGRFQWTPTAAQMGTYTVAFTAIDTARQSATTPVTIDVGTGRPALDPSQTLACSPGAIAHLTGKWLAPSGSALSDPSGAATQLGGVQVQINGASVPVLAASSTQVSFLCPATDPGTPLSVVVETNAGSTAPLSARMQSASPAIVSLDGSGHGQGLISFAGSQDLAMARNFQVPAHPAQPGDSILLWTTGLGAAPEASAVVVHIGGLEVPVDAIQPVAGYAGLSTIQLHVPAAAATGQATPMQAVITAPNGTLFSSNTVTAAVEPVLP